MDSAYPDSLPGTLSVATPASTRRVGAAATTAPSLTPVQIQYPFSLPYQIEVPTNSSSPSVLTPFLLSTTTTGGIGDAVSVPLGSATGRNSWTVFAGETAITTSGDLQYAGGFAQIIVASDGAGGTSLNVSNVGTPYAFGFGGNGKMIPSVAVSGGNVVLTFTPTGDPVLPTALSVSGTILSAVAT